MSESKNGKIEFVPNNAPNLKVGDYVLDATVSVSSKNAKIPISSNNKFKERKRFFVSGERFNINIGDIDSVFPPVNSEGSFDDTLPHLVFSNLSLPWIRSVKAKNTNDELTQEEGENEATKHYNGIPWIALLLFNEDDPAPTPKSIKLKELSKSRDEKIWFPSDFSLEFGENPEDVCEIIDVPVDLFKKIAPSLEDLRWLAHGKIVSVENKIKDKNSVLTGKYSVIIGNRLPANSPEKSVESKVHTVLLEGYAEILDDNSKLDGFHSVRLVTIKNWRFSCKPAQKYSFSTLIEQLDNGKDNNAIFKFNTPKNSSLPEAEKLKYLFDLGYVPMKHKMRQGYNGIAFYRSPLVSSDVDFFINSNMLNENIVAKDYVGNSIGNQDELYRFDPQLKIYDLSYASAWQIGQLLALRNQTFSNSLYKLKRQISQKQIKLSEQKVLKKVFGHEHIGNSLAALQDDFVKAKSNPKLIPDAKQFKKKNPFEREKPLERKEIPEVTIPEEIIGFTEELKRLDHIPFHYLIPDISMLPMESIRFFQIDPNWIASLLEGAMSLGEFMIEPQPFTKTGEMTFKKYGFLIRSSVLVHWPGMEIFVNPKDNKSNPKEGEFITFVRLERLAPDIAICIVDEPIKRILFREPAEGLHFGLDMSAEGKDYKKIIKDIEESNVIEKDFKHKKERTVEIAELAQSFQNKFEGFDTGDFGYQMVQGVETVQYNINT